jgi:hypothetical protein
MRFLLPLVLALAACGDNIHPPARPDAKVYYPPGDERPPEPEDIDPGPDPVMVDAGVVPPSDATVVPPDACIDEFGHEWNGEGTGHCANHQP